MKNTIYIIAIFIFALSLNSCFKDTPKNDMFKAAGSWKVESIESIQYDTLGNQISSKTTENYGFLMLEHNDDFLFEGTFSYDFTQGEIGFTSFDSYMLYLFGGGYGCNTCSVSTDAKAFNLASFAPETLYVTYLYSATIEKLTNKKNGSHRFSTSPKWIFEFQRNLEFRENNSLIYGTKKILNFA